jgi:hypothetical protein
MKESGFGAMVLTVGRLKRLKKIVSGEMKIELGEDDFFKKFGQEGEIGNGAKVFQVIRVEVVFLK